MVEHNLLRRVDLVVWKLPRGSNFSSIGKGRTGPRKNAGGKFAAGAFCRSRCGDGWENGWCFLAVAFRRSYIYPGIEKVGIMTKIRKLDRLVNPASHYLKTRIRA